MNALTIILLFSSVIAGAIIVEIFNIKKSKNIQLLLTFSGAYLLAVSLLHLLPELFKHDTTENIGLYILGGFLIQILLEYFSQGIEHGHFHKSNVIPFSVLTSLCLHALLEGVPLGGHLHNHTHNALLTGIVLHKMPVAIVLMTFFLQSNMKKSKAYLLLFLFALMAPLGVFAGSLFTTLADYHNEIMAIVIGVFLHISTTILFESTEGHRFSFTKIITIIVGVLLAVLSF
ncbi:MAG: ZIP family metal transporter [Flavobacteriales bacterium]|nr:ZIP family metal transporter [Flavobacteriales bacterium]